MNRTHKNLLHLYADITAYATSKILDYGLPRCDLGDIVSEAYLKAQAKMKRHKPRKNRNALFKSLAWSEVMNELERRNRIAALHEKHDLRLDAQKPTESEDEGDDGPENDGFAISDDGEGAAKARYYDDPPEPEWKVGCRVREAELSHTPRDITRAFKKLWDPFDVMMKLGLDEKEFGAFLKKVQIHFDQCFQAYHAWLAENALRID